MWQLLVDQRLATIFANLLGMDGFGNVNAASADLVCADDQGKCREIWRELRFGVVMLAFCHLSWRGFLPFLLNAQFEFEKIVFIHTHTHTNVY